MNKLVLDTSVLIQNNEWLEDNITEYQYIVCSQVCDELDYQKESEIPKRAFMGRTGLRFIEKHENEVKFVIADVCDNLPNGFDLDNHDNKILSCAVRENAILATKDRGLRIKAESIGVKCLKFESYNEEANFDGYKIFEWDCTSDENSKKLNDLVTDDKVNVFELDTNEFAILKDTSRPIFTNNGITNNFETKAIIQWNGIKNIQNKYKNINNSFSGKIQPRNIQQKMLFSLMQNEDIKIKLCSGTYGSGKDFVQLTNSLDLIQKGKYDKIVWFRNNVNVKGIQEMGFLPGTYEEKTAPYSAVLDDILGDQYGTDMFLGNGQLEIGNLGAIRGRTFKNSILFLTEMQNCSKEVIQLLLSRVGEGSILVMNGDFMQIDNVRHGESCIKETIEILKGQPEFGWIQLDKVERSKVADLARLFDEK